MFQFSGFDLRVSGFGSWFSGLRLRILGFGLRFSGFGLRTRGSRGSGKSNGSSDEATTAPMDNGSNDEASSEGGRGASSAGASRPASAWGMLVKSSLPCRANLAHIRESRVDSGLGFQV